MKWAAQQVWTTAMIVMLTAVVRAQNAEFSFDASGSFTGNTGTSSSQNYLSSDSLGGCYSENLTSASGVLTGAVSGSGCHHW